MPKILYLRPMNKILKTSLVFLVAFFAIGSFSGCSGSKSYVKKGAQFETAGLSEEAAKFYFMALQKNANNVEAKIFLKKSAQNVLDNKLADFYKSHGVENYKAAVYTYRDAIDFKNQMERFVSLDVAPYYESYYEESKSYFLKEEYQKGNDLLAEGKFEQAEIIFKQISEINPNYEDVKTLSKISAVEPLYNEGIEFLNAHKYKQAYQNFESVIKIKGAYKDAINYRNQALENAQLSIALLPIETSNKNIEQEIIDRYYAKILSELLATKNEFIKVIDRVNTQKIIEEQKLGLSGLIDESKAARTGELLGAKIVITGKLLDVRLDDGKIESKQERGYQAFRTRKYNSAGKYYYYDTGYEKVEYAEFKGKSSVSSSFEFQMISSETGEVLLSEIYNITKEDIVDYAVFEGDHRMLYPGTWKSLRSASAEDQVYTSVAQKQILDKKLSSRDRNLKTSMQLKTEIIEEIGEKVAKKIFDYEKERN